MTRPFIAKAEQHTYEQLFISDLHWWPLITRRSSTSPTTVHKLTATNVSSYKGLRVWVCRRQPGSQLEARARPGDREELHRPARDLPRRRRAGLALARHAAPRAASTTTGSPATGTAAGTQTRNSRPGSTRFAYRDDIVLDAERRSRVGPDCIRRRSTERDQTCFEAHGAHVRRYREGLPGGSTRGHVTTNLGNSRPHPVPDVRRRHRDVDSPDLFRDFIHHDSTRRLRHRQPSSTNCSYTSTRRPATGQSPPTKLADFPYVNGGIFHEHITLPALNAEFRDASSTPAPSTGPPSAPPSSARCSSPSETPRPDASSGSTTRLRRTSLRR